MKELAPDIPRSLTFRDEVPSDWLDLAKKIDAVFVDFRFSKVTAEMVQVIQQYFV